MMYTEHNRHRPSYQVVAAVIRKNNTVFAAQRGYGVFKGEWEFPGGKIEKGETPESALVREIKEELSVTITVGEKIGHVEYDYPTCHVSMDCFWADVRSGTITVKEHSNVKWLSKEELDSVNWLPADAVLIETVRLKL